MATVPFGKLFPKNGGGGGSIPGPQGPPGEDGADSTVPGLPGTNGTDGTDSTVPGPQGIQGATGPNTVTTATTTNITGLLKGNGSVVSAASAPSDFVATGDARLSDARTPAVHAASHGTGQADAVTIAPAQVTGTAVVTGDVRLSDARTPTAHVHVPNGLCMDGTASILDNMSGAAFTMAGTPTTGTLLGATAPNIAAAKYTSCYFPTPWVAGQAFSVMLIVNTAWAGNDGVEHILFDNNGWGGDSIYLQKHANNNLYLTVFNHTSSYKQKYGAVNGTSWAAGTHIIIFTITADNTMMLYLDGVSLTSTTGSTARESAVAANTYFGTWNNATSPVTGLLLPAFWGWILPANKITALSATSAWTQITPYRWL